LPLRRCSTPCTHWRRGIFQARHNRWLVCSAPIGTKGHELAGRHDRSVDISTPGRLPLLDAVEIISSHQPEAGWSERTIRSFILMSASAAADGRVDPHETRTAHGGIGHRQRRFFHDLLDLRRREIGIGRHQQRGNASQTGRRSGRAVKNCLSRPKPSWATSSMPETATGVERIRRRQRVPLSANSSSAPAPDDEKLSLAGLKPKAGVSAALTAPAAIAPGVMAWPTDGTRIRALIVAESHRLR